VVAVLVIPDGAAEPLGAGPTALERARTPVLDGLAAGGEVARVAVTAPGCSPGSETGIPALIAASAPLPERASRGWIDAAAYSVALAVPAGWTPWRADVLRGDGSRASAAEARATARALGPHAIWTRGHRLVLLAPAGQRPATAPLPAPSVDFVRATRMNSTLGGAVGLRVRLWPDGAALPCTLDGDTVVVCGPGAAAGCARLLGADVVVPATATGDVDTDLAAKAGAAIDAIERGIPRVVVHVGAPDEAAHRRDPDAKAAALTLLDAHLMAPLRDTVQRAHGTLAVCPDHGTDPRTGAHDAAPVPALRWGAGVEPAGADRMTERASADAAVHAPDWPLAGARVEAIA
jgi:2,3-bisphosphoglycerate-independent phosphoglycerate mutase